jgi:hypothetical protein
MNFLTFFIAVFAISMVFNVGIVAHGIYTNIKHNLAIKRALAEP